MRIYLIDHALSDATYRVHIIEHITSDTSLHYRIHHIWIYHMRIRIIGYTLLNTSYANTTRADT